MNNNTFKSCSRCLIDSKIPGVLFDDNNLCNYCNMHDEQVNKYPLNEEGKKQLDALVKSIKIKCKNKKYDCIVGVSGGTDSTYALYIVKKLGLRPLAVHFDNGWNSEIAVSNIHNAVKKLEVDLYTHVVDWEQFKDLQLSFLKASVPDLEMPTDMGINATLYMIADKEGVPYIIHGKSFRAEGWMPHGWSYQDGKYLKRVHKIFGTKTLKKFPVLTIYKLFYYIFLKKIKKIKLLDYIEYSKQNARKILEKELDWKDYGGHNFESIYTRFANGYYRLKKFNIDKRIVVLSAQIRSNIITKEEALITMKTPPYTEEAATKDKDYIIRKLNISSTDYDKILNSPPHSFLDYPTHYSMFRSFFFIIRFFANLELLPVTLIKGKYNLTKADINYGK